MSDSEDSIDPNDYSINEYYRLVQPLWSFDNNHERYFNSHKLLRTLLDFSLTHSLNLKNLQKRDLILGDLECIDIETNKGISINIDGTYNGLLRHKYVEFCTQLALSSYLFSRFHLPDEYDSLEFLQNTKIDLNEVKLLKGSNKLSSISYSQQHKSSINALSLSGLNYKTINLCKLLTAHEFESKEKLTSNTISHIPANTIANLAGFSSISEYSIERDSVEPPQELLNQIFPFINELLDILSIVFKELRRTLLQDMVVIRKKYPQHTLSKHPTFNSDLFNKYADDVESLGLISAVFRPKELEKKFLHTPASTSNNIIEMQQKQIIALEAQSKAIIDTLKGFVERQSQVFELQNDCLQRIQNNSNGLSILISSGNKHTLPLAQLNLQETSELYAHANGNLNQGLQYTVDLINNLNTLTKGDYKELQNKIKYEEGPSEASRQESDYHRFSKESEVARRFSGDLVPPRFSQDSEAVRRFSGDLVPPRFSPRDPYREKSPLATIAYSNQQTPTGTRLPEPPGLSNTLTAPYTLHPLQNPIPQQIPIQQHIPMQQHIPQQIPQIPIPHITHIPHIQMQQHVSHSQNIPQFDHNAPQPPVSPEILKRQAVLSRRLSRQASTLYEMWDDFKDLEKDLRDNEITITEWLKIHGSSERQFRHTRLKIIKFIEDEALRRNCDVEIVKEKLHNKMRNRLRPWTLDEVQRMLTSGKRIKLDD